MIMILVLYVVYECLSDVCDTDTDTRYILCPLYHGVDAGGAG